MTALRSKLQGVVPAIIVPFRGEQIDRDAMAREVEFLSEAGVDGLAIGGGIGEMTGRSAEEWAAVCRVVNEVSDLPLGVILLPDCWPELDRMLDAVMMEEPDTLLVAQPHYLFQPAAKEVEELLHRARVRSRRPVFLANILRSAMIPARVVAELMRKPRFHVRNWQGRGKVREQIPGQRDGLLFRHPCRAVRSTSDGLAGDQLILK